MPTFQSLVSCISAQDKKMLVLQPFWSLRCLSQMQTNKENLANWLDVWAKLLYGLVSWWRCRSLKNRFTHYAGLKQLNFARSLGQLQRTDTAWFHFYFKVRVKLVGEHTREFVSVTALLLKLSIAIYSLPFLFTIAMQDRLIVSSIQRVRESDGLNLACFMIVFVWHLPHAEFTDYLKELSKPNTRWRCCLIVWVIWDNVRWENC